MTALVRTVSTTALKGGKAGDVAKKEGALINGPAKDYANLPKLRLVDDKLQGNIDDAVIQPKEANWKAFIKEFTKTMDEFHQTTFVAGHNYIFVVLPRKYNLKSGGDEIRLFDEAVDGGTDAGHTSLLTLGEMDKAERLSRVKTADTGVVLWAGQFKGGDKKHAPFNIKEWDLRSGHFKPPLMNAEVFAKHWGFPVDRLDKTGHHNARQIKPNLFGKTYNRYEGKYIGYNDQIPSLKNQHSKYLYTPEMNLMEYQHGGYDGYGAYDGYGGYGAKSIANFDNQLITMNMAVIVLLFIFTVCLVISCLCGGIVGSYIFKRVHKKKKRENHELDIQSRV